MGCGDLSQVLVPAQQVHCPLTIFPASGRLLACLLMGTMKVTTNLLSGSQPLKKNLSGKVRAFRMCVWASGEEE